MTNEEIGDSARRRLSGLSAGEKAADLKAFLLGYRPGPDHADDFHAWLACVLALEGVAAGNFGIGAVLVDDGGRVAAHGHNEMFHPRFRSDRHAEMVVMDRWEDSDPEPAGGTLVTSVEPCPMCLIRLSSSAVRRVLYVAPDLTGGMVRRMDGLPPYWAEVARGKVFAEARCSADLTEAAGQIFLCNLEELTARVKARGSS